MINLATFSEDFVPANTEANTEWAVRNFEAWADWRIAQNPDDPVPSDILSCGDTVALNNLAVAFFVRDRDTKARRRAISSFHLELASCLQHVNSFILNYNSNFVV